MSKFLENIVDKIDGDDSSGKVGDEHYGTKQFERTCKSSDFDAQEKTEGAENSENSEDSENDAVVINANNKENEDNEITPKAPHEGELPVLIFEGLPEPRTKGFRTEERLIESILNETMGIPESSVRRAFRHSDTN